jgi:homoserine acetyltransferase
MPRPILQSVPPQHLRRFHRWRKATQPPTPNPEAGQLFGPGQSLDASKYFIILPDAVGTGRSTKPSDGLRAQFPRYNYVDMVTAHHWLVTEGLGLKHVRMVLGNSMGGNQALQRLAPTREKADQLLDQQLKATATTGDANDILYQWDSSRDHHPLTGLEKIKATLLAINAADDERNPPEPGVMERALQRVARALLQLGDARHRAAGQPVSDAGCWHAGGGAQGGDGFSDAARFAPDAARARLRHAGV